MDQRFNGDNPSRRHWAQAQAALTTKIATSGVTVRIARPRCCHGGISEPPPVSTHHG
jgi:hypothetical protein